MATTNLAELRKKSSLPAREMGGQNVAAFFEANKTAIEAVLPSKVSPDRLLRIALGAIRTTPALMDCSTKSLLGAVVQCAQLGLEPNTPLGHEYLVPYRNKGNPHVQVIVGYKGFLDLARRSGQIVSIAAHEVRKNDHFDFSYGLGETLEHKPKLDGDRGEIIAFYAIAKLKDGGYAIEVMPKDDVDRIMRGSQSRGQSGPWKEHYVEMGRKTAIRRLVKYLPLSIELATAEALDSRADTGNDQGMDRVLDGDYVVATDDAPAVSHDPEPEVVSAQAQAQAKQPEPSTIEGEFENVPAFDDVPDSFEFE